MSKGTQTREMILARAAQIFSRQGYFGASLSDIMQETGLEKGGIYNHFTSKEHLALEAFDYAIELVEQQTRKELADRKHAADRLLGIVAVFQWLIEEQPLIGGCPILTTAIEADDAQPALRDKARIAMDGLRSTIFRVVAKGIERHEIRPEVDVESLTTLLIATLEGAVMLSKLYTDATHMHRAVAFLTNYINTSVRV